MDSPSSGTDGREDVLMTHIRVTCVESNVDHTLGDLHVALEINGKITKPTALVGRGKEVDNETLSSESSATSLNVRASFELGPILGNGQMFRNFKIPLPAVHDQVEQHQSISFFLQKDDISQQCSSIRIVSQQPICDVNESAPKCDLPKSDAMGDDDDHTPLCHCQSPNQLGPEDAPRSFDHSQGLDAAYTSNHSAVLVNFTHERHFPSEVNYHHFDLDVLLTLYRDALRLGTSGRPDYCGISLVLCFSLLVRLRNQGDEADRTEAKDLLSRLLEILPAESYEYRAACLALKMAMESGMSQIDGARADDEGLIQRGRSILPDMADTDPRRLTILAGLGSLLYRRFEDIGGITVIREAISMLDAAVQLAPDGHFKKPALLSLQGSSLSSHMELFDDLSNIDHSISMIDEAVRLTPNNHPDRPAWLSNLGISLMRRFQHLGNFADVNKAIFVFEEAIRLTPNSHRDRPVWLNNLAISLSRRFERLGDAANIDKSILIFEEAVHLTPHGHPELPSRLNNLGSSLCHRFKHFGHLTDINKAILMFEEALRLSPTGHPHRPTWLCNLGCSLSRRFQHTGDPADIDQSVSMFEQGVLHRLNDHQKRVMMANLLDLSSGYSQCLDDSENLDRTISFLGVAVRLDYDGDPPRHALLQVLGTLFSDRYKRTGDLVNVDIAISTLKEAVRTAPNDNFFRPTYLSCLAAASYFRSHPSRSNDIADLNDCIDIHEETVHATPDDDSDKPELSHRLADLLRSRFHRQGDHVDLDKSILASEEAVRLAPSGHPDKPNYLAGLAASLYRRSMRTDDLIELDKSILLFEEALFLTPNGHPQKPVILHTLGYSFESRFRRYKDLTDLDKSILLIEEALHLTPHDDPVRPARFQTLGNALHDRYGHLGALADLQKSISMHEAGICLIPDHHPDRPRWLMDLGTSLTSRFVRLRDLADLDRNISLLEEAIHLIPIDHADVRTQAVGSLGAVLGARFHVLGHPADFERSVSIKREAIRLTPTAHPDMPAHLLSLAISVIDRLHHDLPVHVTEVDESISLCEEAMRLTPSSHAPMIAHNLGNLFFVRFKHTRDPFDLSTASLHLATTSRARSLGASARFPAASFWFKIAVLQHNSRDIVEACTTTVGLLQELAWVGLPLSERYLALVETASATRDAVTAVLEAGHPEVCVELLEQGRSVVWSQFLQLRTPVDDLHVEHSDLADQFQRVSQQLERVGSSLDMSYTRMSNTNRLSLEEEAQMRHSLALHREKLLIEIRSLPGFERFLLPRTINELPALAHSGPVVYLNASRFHPSDSEAFIVKADSVGSVITVSLTDIGEREIKVVQRVLRFLLHSSGLATISHEDIAELVQASEENFASRQLFDVLLGEDVRSDERAAKVKPQRVAGFTPNEMFQNVLGYLWFMVVKPILNALGISTPPRGAEKKTHIYWCTTGPYSFLPIHAAGLYGTTEPGTKLSDFAISSYIPTLSSIASSPRKDQNGSSSHIRLVAVPQPPTDGQGALVSVKEEMDHIRTLSTRSPFVTLEDSDGTVEDVMEKMSKADWVHFACHGVQDLDNPLDSGLCLANGRRLKLSDIIRLARPQGGLAFLSACQTAQGDKKLAEESVHLAAGMLLAGYGGVIATMWAIMDADAPKVTRDVYAHLFRDGKVPDCMEAAEALHDAVQRLRDSGAPFTSWVPFIHVGR